MKLKLISALIILLLGTPAFAASTADSNRIELTKKDYLTLIVGNYIHGFSDYDTSVTTSDHLVSIGIYFDSPFQAERDAYELAKYFRETIPQVLKQYSWAKGVVIEVNVYPEKRIPQEYIRSLSE